MEYDVEEGGLEKFVQHHKTAIFPAPFLFVFGSLNFTFT